MSGSSAMGLELVVNLEQRFERTPDGCIWSHAAYRPEYWRCPLQVFEGIRIVARVRDVAEPSPRAVQADGPGVGFAPLPYYIGPWQYLRQRASVRRAVAEAAAARPAAFLLHVPSQTATLLRLAVVRAGLPFGVQVLSDPEAVFAPGAVRHALRPILRRAFVRRLRDDCAGACAVSFVTARALQAKYPPAAGAFVTSFSDVQLLPQHFAPQARAIRSSPATPRIITVTTLTQLYKAPDVLLDAVALCRGQGVELQLAIAGDGRLRPALERRSARLGLDGQVRFLGELLAGDAVRDALDRADLFVLSSRAEGLPRALVEAMARGLPCIGSAVGGIPELLAAEDLVPPSDGTALARALLDVLRDPQRMARMSERNLARARDYALEALLPRQMEFYSSLRVSTERRLAQARA